MASPQVNDIHSSGFSDTDPPRPPHIAFCSSVGLIPTPGTVSKRYPTYEPFLLRYWVVCLGCALLAALGIALEIAQTISVKRQGFPLPENIFSITSKHFLTSFLPSVIFLPLAAMVRGFDWSIRLWNPYLILSRGNAAADETLLVNYVADGRPAIMFNALRFKHRLILVSGTTVMGALLLQPLAGSIFFLEPFPQSSASSVQSTRVIGLSPNIADLTAFVASAGFAESAVYNNLADPPFVLGGWATAEFVFPSDPYLNGTMTVNTTGIQTSTNCAVPNQASVTPSYTDASTVSATSIDGCSLELTFTPSAAPQQYGVVNVPNCGINTTDPAFQPVRQFFGEGIRMFIPSRFSSGFGNKIQAALPVFSVSRSYSFSM